MLRSLLLVAIPALALLPANAAPPGKSKATLARDAFFKNGKVVTLELAFDKKEADSLRREPRKYAKATLKEGDKTFANVAVHLKGAAGSWRNFDDKPGLTINMDKFKDDQRFHGMDKFHLANSVQDPSYLSELICGELFRAAGVPASRVGHALVIINGRKQGLYYIKEGYDRHFIREHFKNDRGNFYDGGFLRDIDQPLQLITTKDDVRDYKDLKALISAAREPDIKKRFAALEKLLEMDSFISYMVLESLTWDWDGYPFKCNNYRIYHNPATNKITFIPSGMDQMFGDPNGPALPGFGGMVAQGVISTPEGKKRYFDRMRIIMKTVFKPDDLVKRLDELEKRVQPALASVDPGAGRDYKNQVNRLKEGIRQRYKNVEAELKRIK